MTIGCGISHTKYNIILKIILKISHRISIKFIYSTKLLHVNLHIYTIYELNYPYSIVCKEKTLKCHESFSNIRNSKCVLLWYVVIVLFADILYYSEFIRSYVRTYSVLSFCQLTALLQFLKL
jgi:hypothetical protein